MKNVYLMVAQLQSGKDTFGKMLAESAGAEIFAFAEPVKEIAIQLLDMPRDVAYGGEAARRVWVLYGKDAREWLQWIGTEMGRQQVDNNVWIDRLCDRVRNCNAPAFVITDGRFKNEILELEQNLGPNYRVVRVRLQRPGFQNEITHASEAEQLEIPDSEFHEIVVNDGGLEELQAKALTMATKYRSAI